MLVKRITAKGDPVPFTPQEAALHAVARAVKGKNTTEAVYWIDRKSIHVDEFKSTNVGIDGSWEAWAKGRVGIGKAVAATGKFHEPKPHSFEIHYRSCKDELGVPDIEVLAGAKLSLLETNPSVLVANGPAEAPQSAPVPAEPLSALDAESEQTGALQKKSLSKGKN